MSVAPERPRRKIRLVTFYKGNCAKSTAHRWIKDGKLRAFRFGRMTFVDVTFDEFVERMAAEQEAAQQKTPQTNQATASSANEPTPLAARSYSPS